MSKGQLLVPGAVVLAGAALVILTVVWKADLQDENARLRQQLDLLNRERQGQEPSSNVVASSTDSLSEGDRRELLRLRSEVGFLREQSNLLAQLENERLRAGAAVSPSNTLPHFISREQWEFRGYATPEDALGSLLWAARELDAGAFLAGLAPEMRAAMENLGEERAALGAAQEIVKLGSYRILKSWDAGGNEIVLDVSFDGVKREVRLRQIQGQWQLAAPIGNPSRETGAP